MIEKRFETWQLGDIHPYENNPRLNDDAVDAVAESIRQTGNLDPIEVDEDGVILSGHTRLKALKKLKYAETEVMVVSGLTEEQKRKYRLLANKTNEFAMWDADRLAEELDGLDFGDFDFLFEQDLEGLLDEEDENPYSPKVKIPQYEVTGAKPMLSELYDTQWASGLIAEIDAANVTEDEKDFLRKAAYRHTVFNYKNIAEYYANATPEMQQLMERSALVIIDIDDAIANGYAKLTSDIMEMVEDMDDA